MFNISLILHAPHCFVLVNCAFEETATSLPGIINWISQGKTFSSKPSQRFWEPLKQKEPITLPLFLATPSQVCQFPLFLATPIKVCQFHQHSS